MSEPEAGSTIGKGCSGSGFPGSGSATPRFPPHHYLIAQLLALRRPHPKRPWQRKRPGTAPLFTPTQVALLIGMHPQSVQALLRKPSFRALLREGAGEQEGAGEHSPGLSPEEFWALRQRAILNDCLDRIQHKLLEEPDLSMNELRKVTMGLIKSAGLGRKTLWGRPVSPEVRIGAKAIFRTR